GLAVLEDRERREASGGERGVSRPSAVLPENPVTRQCRPSSNSGSAAFRRSCRSGSDQIVYRLQERGGQGTLLSGRFADTQQQLCRCRNCHTGELRERTVDGQRLSRNKSWRRRAASNNFRGATPTPNTPQHKRPQTACGDLLCGRGDGLRGRCNL